MAAVTGSVTAPNLFYEISDNAGNCAGPSNPQSLYYVFRASVQHEDWELNNIANTLSSHTVTRQMYIAASGEVSEFWRIGSNSKQAFAGEPIVNTTTGNKSNSQIHIPEGSVMADKRAKQTPYILARQKVWNSDPPYGTIKLYMTEFRATNDTAYSGTGVEMVQRNANRLYAPDYPCSAWHVMKALIETHEKILYENRTIFSIPVFGDAAFS